MYNSQRNHQHLVRESVIHVTFSNTFYKKWQKVECKTDLSLRMKEKSRKGGKWKIT